MRFDGEADFDGSVMFNNFSAGLHSGPWPSELHFLCRREVSATVTMDNWYAFDGTANLWWPTKIQCPNCSGGVLMNENSVITKTRRRKPLHGRQ